MTLHDKLSSIIYENLDAFKPRYDIAQELAGTIIDELDLSIQYENSRVMYPVKPKECKPNGNWTQRIVGPFEEYTG